MGVFLLVAAGVCAAGTLVFGVLFLRAHASDLCARIRDGKEDERLLSRRARPAFVAAAGRAVLAAIVIASLICAAQSLYFTFSGGAFFGPYMPLAVASGSMSEVRYGNTVSEGAKEGFSRFDIVFIARAEEEDLAAGDIIAFYSSGGELIIHRIKQKFSAGGNTYFITQGDANPCEDGEAVGMSSVVGIYTGVRVPFIGAAALFLNSWYGLISLFCAIVVAAFYDRAACSVSAAERERLALLRAGENKI